MNKTIFDIKNKETGNGELQLKGKNKIISWNTIPGIRWKLITIVDENQLYAETNSLAKQFEQIGYPRIQIISATVMDWRRGEASC